LRFSFLIHPVIHLTRSGVHGILHTASPIDFTKTEYDDFVVPAVHGTQTLLNSALKFAGPQLEAVVVTSSVRAVMGEVITPGKEYTEEDWAEDSLAIADKNKAEGKPTPGGTLYGASKIAAEKEVWKFRDEQKVWNSPTVTFQTDDFSLLLHYPLFFLLSSSVHQFNSHHLQTL
jgi:nucleoside-diphosphate-sugar epimerase